MINQHPGGERPAAGLVMEQIGKRFASVTALNAVTLRLNPGEIHGLIGENGAGKSTLIRSSPASIRPTAAAPPSTVTRCPRQSGSHRSRRHPRYPPGVEPDPALYRRGIGVSGPGVSHPLGGAGSPTDEGRHGAIFPAKLAAGDRPERLVRDLSLAERKLVQIARALIDGAARLVVFDEPTAPLEAQEASLVSSAILRLRDQGIAILVYFPLPQ